MASHGRCHLAVVGDCFADVYAGPVQTEPKFDADVLAGDPIEIRPGGSALNTAVQAQRLYQNTCVSLHSAIGNDVMGKMLKDHLDKFPALRVCLADVENLSKQATGACIVLYNAENRGFITHRGCIEEFRMDASSGYDGATHIHVAGAFNCNGLLQSLPEQLVLLKEQEPNLTVSLSPQYDATEQWNLDEILPQLDILILNHVEALKLSRKDSLSAAIEILTTKIPLVVITLGSDGALACTQKERHRVPACVVDKIVDTTGAGDGFSAGFLWFWTRNSGLHARTRLFDSLKWGCAVASCCITQVGGSTPIQITALDHQYSTLPMIIGISGPSNSGKTSLSARLQSLNEPCWGMGVTLVSQDFFYKPNEQVPKLPTGEYDWDHPEALDAVKIVEAIHVAARSGTSIIFVEGTMIPELPSVVEWLQVKIILDATQDACRERRTARTDYDPPDPVGYFDSHVWPKWQEQRARLTKDSSNIFVDAAGDPGEVVSRVRGTIFSSTKSSWTES